MFDCEPFPFFFFRLCLVVFFLFLFQQILQSEQFVAILCSFYEIQLLSCLLHEFACALHALLQLLFRHVLYNWVGSQHFWLRRHVGICLRLLRLFRILRIAGQNVVSCLLDLLRRNAVRFIISQLLFAAAVSL